MMQKAFSSPAISGGKFLLISLFYLLLIVPSFAIGYGWLFLMDLARSASDPVYIMANIGSAIGCWGYPIVTLISIPMATRYRVFLIVPGLIAIVYILLTVFVQLFWVY